MERNDANSDSRNGFLALIPILGWVVSQIFKLIDSSFTGRKALITFVLSVVISIVTYTAVRAVANYRKLIRK